jgi:hypothetical protein
MSGDRLFPPKEKGFRAPTTDAKKNGDVYNPPRFPEMGGLKNSRKIGPKGPFSVKTPTTK